MTSVEQPLQITVAETERGVEITPEGELDIATASSLLETFHTAFVEGVTDVVLDASRLDFVDSVGVSLLVTLHKRAEATGKLLTIRTPSPQLLRQLEVAGLSSYFHLA